MVMQEGATNMTIANITNEEYGIEVVVSQTGASRFSVVLRDTDADEIFPVAHIHATLEAAMADAHKIAGV
jgi:hypothetical protein